MRRHAALADLAVSALLAHTDQRLVSGAVIPRADVGAATGAGHAD